MNVASVRSTITRSIPDAIGAITRCLNSGAVNRSTSPLTATTCALPSIRRSSIENSIAIASQPSPSPDPRRRAGRGGTRGRPRSRSPVRRQAARSRCRRPAPRRPRRARGRRRRAAGRPAGRASACSRPSTTSTVASATCAGARAATTSATSTASSSRSSGRSARAANIPTTRRSTGPTSGPAAIEMRVGVSASVTPGPWPVRCGGGGSSSPAGSRRRGRARPPRRRPAPRSAADPARAPRCRRSGRVPRPSRSTITSSASPLGRTTTSIDALAVRVRVPDDVRARLGDGELACRRSPTLSGSASASASAPTTRRTTATFSGASREREADVRVQSWVPSCHRSWLPPMLYPRPPPPNAPGCQVPDSARHVRMLTQTHYTPGRASSMRDPWRRSHSQHGRPRHPPADTYAIELHHTAEGSSCWRSRASSTWPRRRPSASGSPPPGRRRRRRGARHGGGHVRGLVRIAGAAARRRALSEQGARLVLAALRPVVARLLELTGTTGLLTVAPTVEEALRRAAPPQIGSGLGSGGSGRGSGTGVGGAGSGPGEGSGPGIGGSG